MSQYRIDPNVLAEILEPQEVCISPDGKQVVYVTRPSHIRASDHMQSAVWIAELGKENSARQLTQDDFNHWSPSFSPDGKYVAFMSDRSKPGSSGVLYLLPLGGGEAFPLTSTDNEMSVQTYRWRPDGKAIAYTSPDEKSDERKRREKDGPDVKVYGEDIDFGRLRIIDVATKKTKDLRSVQRHGTDVAWNSSGTKLVYVTTETPELNDVYCAGKIHIVDPENDSSEQLCAIECHLVDVAWHKDRILVVGRVEEGSQATAKTVYAVDLNGANRKPKMIAYGTSDDVVTIKVRNEEVVCWVEQGLTNVIETLDGKQLRSVKHDVRGLDAHFEPSQTSLVVIEGKIGTPPEVFSFINGKQTQLSQLGKEIADKKIGRAELLEYTHDDGTPLDGFYAIPSQLESDFVEKRPLPTIVWVRGGPFGRVTDCFNYLFHWNSFFMSLGYLVLCPNYRGGSSHGEAYAHAVYHDATANYQDVIWLVRKGIEEGHIDPERVMIAGWSQGGFTTFTAITRDDTFHFRAAIAGAGPSHWSTLCLTSDIPRWESAMSAPCPWDIDINDITERKSSPIYHIDKVKTPLLILHGEADVRVTIEQGIGFYRGMKARGKEVELVTYTGESHCVPMPWKQKNVVDMSERVEKFIKKHMES